MDLIWRRGRLDGGEGLEDPVGVLRTLGNQPGVAGLEEDHLALDVELGTAGDDEANGLVLAPGCRLLVGGRLLFPEAHRERLAGREVLRAHLAARGVGGVDLLHGGVCSLLSHGVSAVGRGVDWGIGVQGWDHRSGEWGVGVGVCPANRPTPSLPLPTPTAHSPLMTPTQPYGPNTPAVRRFLQRLAGKPASDCVAAARIYLSLQGTPEFSAADRTLGRALETSGRTDARDAVVGPLVQLLSGHAERLEAAA